MNRFRIGVLLLAIASPAGLAPAAPPDKTPEKAPGKAADKSADEAPARATAPAGKADARAPKKAAPAEARPSPEDIQEAFDAGDYQGTLQKVGRVINLKGDAAAGYDKYTLWMLKGESHLRLKQLKQAGEAFGMAAKATDDDAEGAKARATQRMLAAAKSYQVKRSSLRRGEKPQSADILDPAQREQAFRILYEDARVETGPAIKAALKARDLPPIANALKALADGHDLEVAATGGKAELSGAREDVTRRARELIDRELSDMRERVETIREEANKTIERRTYRPARGTGDVYGQDVRAKTGIGGARGAKEARDAARRRQEREAFERRRAVGGGTYQRVIKRGLTDDDREDLVEVIGQCKKILPAIDELAEASRAEVDAFDDLIKLTKEVGTLAERTLNDKYEADK